MKIIKLYWNQGLKEMEDVVNLFIFLPLLFFCMLLGQRCQCCLLAIIFLTAATKPETQFRPWRRRHCWELSAPATPLPPCRRPIVNAQRETIVGFLTLIILSLVRIKQPAPSSWMPNFRIQAHGSKIHRHFRLAGSFWPSSEYATTRAPPCRCRCLFADTPKK